MVTSRPSRRFPWALWAYGLGLAAACVSQRGARTAAPDAGATTTSAWLGPDATSGMPDGALDASVPPSPDATVLPPDDAGLEAEASATTQNLQGLKQDFVKLRFGMWLHFGILTYTGTWAQANLDITQFNPTGLDPNQWASAAKSAGMTFGVLTTRHHDGFALWPSAASSFNVGHIPWQGGQGDVVRQYVDAFRAAGLAPGLYYSIWDNTEGVGNGPVTVDQMTYLTTQLTELLTNYGPIPLLIFDGWSWRMGHNAVAFEQIHDLVKRLQPNILIADHDGLQSPFDADLVMFEEPKGAFAPPGNTWAAAQGNKINSAGGNDWFWAPNIGGLMSVSTIVTGHLDVLGPRYTNFILNCPPNRQGLLDPAIVSLLAQVGQAWTPSSLPPLPDQGDQNNHPFTPVGATATSGTASHAIDGLNDYGKYTLWYSSSGLPQSLTIDLGSVRSVGFLGYLPPYLNSIAGPTSTDSVTSYAISVSSDGTAFSEVARGTWPADGNLQHATFPAASARYVQLQALPTSSGDAAAATEVTVGGPP